MINIGVCIILVTSHARSSTGSPDLTLAFNVYERVSASENSGKAVIKDKNESRQAVLSLSMPAHPRSPGYGFAR